MQYIEGYVNTANSVAHDLLNQLLKIKTELLIANHLVEEKQKEIVKLQNVNNILTEKQKGLEQKVTHIETFKNQVTTLNKQIEELKNKTKKPRKKKIIANTIPVFMEKKPNDDF